MNYQLSFWVFLGLTIMHPIGDFLTPYRRLGISNWRELKTRIGWRKFLLSEWILVINPLHGLYDKYSPIRKHPQYAEFVSNPTKTYNQDGTYSLDDLNREEYLKVTWWFWRWLAVDQLYHMITNALVALLLGFLL